jgi:hypothetical protein
VTWEQSTPCRTGCCFLLDGGEITIGPHAVDPEMRDPSLRRAAILPVLMVVGRRLKRVGERSIVVLRQS